MRKFKYLLLTSALVSAIASPVKAQTQLLDRIESYNDRAIEQEQITNVFQLRDVSPGDWAFEALRSLVERYGCVVGFPDRTFRGNRALTRYEFAAGLNACLERIEKLAADSWVILEEDLARLKRLQEEFATELERVTVKIDDLEDRIVFLEENQFSTTTILRGSLSFNLADAVGDKKAVPSGNLVSNEDISSNLTFSSRVSLTFDTSFTGRDLLRTRIQAGNVNNFGRSITGTNMTRFNGATNTDNDVTLSTLFYGFRFADRGIAAIAARGDFPTRIFPALNPVFSISTFGGSSPIYSFAFGAGSVVYYQFNDWLAAGTSYFASNTEDPITGLFGGQFTNLSQITLTPTDRLGIAFDFARYYSPEPGDTINVTGSKGSIFGERPFGDSTATSSNSYGLQATYSLSDRFILGGWLSYFNPTAESVPIINNIIVGDRGSRADIFSWAVTAALPDLGKLGSQLNFVFGMPPKVTSNDVTSRRDLDTSYHLEVSYRYRLTNRINLTPGFLVIVNPEHNNSNDPIWLGLFRTSYSF